MKALTDSYTLLAVDTSAGPASCAVICTKNGIPSLLCESSVNTRLTHSQTLLPMLTGMLCNAGMTTDDVDALAVAVGPGSFTGVRIGVAAVKGLAFPQDLPCVPVSTLEGMAFMWEGIPYEGLILTAMDARRSQLYTALFRSQAGTISRLTPDEALSLESVGERLKNIKDLVLVVGDGADLCYNTLKGVLPTLWKAPLGMVYQHATGVARAALPLIADGKVVSGEALLPAYLRLPQAERELRLRQK